MALTKLTKAQLAAENAALRAENSELRLKLEMHKDLQAQRLHPSPSAQSAWKLRAAAARAAAIAGNKTVRMP